MASSSPFSARRVRQGSANQILLRKCACGGSHAVHGECEACRRKRLSADSSAIAANEGQRGDIPNIVQEVLESPGQPLDTQARAFFEPRFGHDFSKVRIHTDGKAGESAQSVNALAYTVGNHISFGPGTYLSHGRQGRQLLAHELAHVVQQSRNEAGPLNSEAHLEADADRAASSVMSHTAVPGLASARQVLQRQQGGPAPTPVQPTAPNAHQQGIIEAARRAAAIRCQTAMFRVRGVVPSGPPGGIDPASEMALRARSLARVMFNWDNPNMEQIGDIVGSMVNFLTSRVPVMIAGAGDPDCGNRDGYVRGFRPPIVLCPKFFSSSAEQQVRTMIHESAHLARIGSADPNESYCVDFDCATSCGGFDSADSWAHFVHCLSGQTPDKPTTITGHATPGGQTQPPSQAPQPGGGGAH
jgi:hypothetical protein